MMKFKKVLLTLLAVLAVFSYHSVYAWEHEVSAGYGWGEEFDEDYHNSVFIFGGKFYKFPKIDDTLIATIDGSIAQLHADTDEYKNIITAAVSLALRAYFADPDVHKIRPYLTASFGPAYISDKQFGERQQGSNFLLQSILGGGIEFGLKNQRSIDVNLYLLHYSNAGLASPNEGFDVPFVLSIGYQF